MHHLIIVPCHAVWNYESSFDTKCPGQDPAEWFMAPFQKATNDHLKFVEHVRMASALVRNDKNALLLFSGSATKKETTLTESRSYYKLAENLGILRQSDVEEYARDSYENLLFSLLRFYQLCGSFPKKITIVGFMFKQKRFLELHAPALNLSNVHYIGNNPKGESETFMRDLEKLEYRNAVSLFEKDRFGCLSPLVNKKISRDPHGRRHNYSTDNKSVRILLEMDYVGTEEQVLELYSSIRNNLPWN